MVGRSRCAATGAGFDQANQQRRQVAGHRVLQRNHFHVGGAGHVERADDAPEALQIAGIVGDDQRVVAGVDVDGVVGADQRTQDGHQMVGGLVVEAENLRHDLV